GHDARFAGEDANPPEPPTHGSSQCRCEPCRADRTARTNRARSEVQGETLETASRYGHQWTGAALGVLMKMTGEYKDEEIARHLGRSLFALRFARYQIRSGQPSYCIRLYGSNYRANA